MNMNLQIKQITKNQDNHQNLTNLILTMIFQKLIRMNNIHMNKSKMKITIKKIKYKMKQMICPKIFMKIQINIEI